MDLVTCQSSESTTSPSSTSNGRKKALSSLFSENTLDTSSKVSTSSGRTNQWTKSIIGKVRSSSDSSNLLTSPSVTKATNRNGNCKSGSTDGKVAPKATLSEVDAGTLSLSRSSSNLSLPDVTMPLSPTEATEGIDVDMKTFTSSSSSSSSSSSCDETNSTASLEVCCCEVSCDKKKWTRFKEIYRCPRNLMIQVNQSKVKKRLFMALSSLCTGLDPISTYNFYPSASSLPPHLLSPAVSSSNPLQYPDISTDLSTDLNTGHHSWPCPAVHSINCSITVRRQAKGKAKCNLNFFPPYSTC